METAAELQAIGSAFADMKQEALSHVAGAALAVDREKVQQDARDDFLKEILLLLEETLSPGCFDDAQEALPGRVWRGLKMAGVVFLSDLGDSMR